MLNSGIEHILHQVVDAKMYTQFLPKISDFIEEHSHELRKVNVKFFVFISFVWKLLHKMLPFTMFCESSAMDTQFDFNTI